MPNIVYNKFKEQAIRGNINLVSDVVNVALLTDTYTPNADHDTFSVIASGNQVVGSDY